MLVGRLGSAEPDIVPQGPGKQERLLQHQADLAAVALQVVFLDVQAVHGDSAFDWIIEPAQKINNRSFSCACVPDQSDSLARLGCEADVMQHDLAGVVAEGHILELHPADDLGHGLKVFVNLGFRGHDPFNTHSPGQCPLDDAVGLGKAP